MTPRMHSNLLGTQPFRHEALFYGGDEELLNSLEPFVRDGVRAGEKVLVVLGPAKLESLRAALGRDSKKVAFADMDEVGANPARIMPLWSAFVDDLSPGQGARGVGEPVTSARKAAELAECQLHESLLNLAFAGAPRFWLLCPYDTTALSGAVLDEARTSHASIRSPVHLPVASALYEQADSFGALAGRDLPAAPEGAVNFLVDGEGVGSSRRRVHDFALQFGFYDGAAADYALAVHEVIANSLKHGGGRAHVTIWGEGDNLICEVRDRGRFDEPMAGRQHPLNDSQSGRGLWMANQLCDLVQIRNLPRGTAVRLHKHLRSARD